MRFFTCSSLCTDSISVVGNKCFLWIIHCAFCCWKWHNVHCAAAFSFLLANKSWYECAQRMSKHTCRREQNHRASNIGIKCIWCVDSFFLLLAFHKRTALEYTVRCLFSMLLFVCDRSHKQAHKKQTPFPFFFQENNIFSVLYIPIYVHDNMILVHVLTALFLFILIWQRTDLNSKLINSPFYLPTVRTIHHLAYTAAFNVCLWLFAMKIAQS